MKFAWSSDFTRKDLPFFRGGGGGGGGGLVQKEGGSVPGLVEIYSGSRKKNAVATKKRCGREQCRRREQSRDVSARRSRPSLEENETKRRRGEKVELLERFTSCTGARRIYLTNRRGAREEIPRG